MPKPNIIFILIDDMGWKDLSCQGSIFYETPNIDSLAKRGMRFTRAYASCPVCSPTRASLLTGKYPARVGITQWIGGKTKGKVISADYLHYLPPEEYNLAKILSENGYRTYHVGKWHLGDEPYYPEHQGFDVNVAGCHWGNPYHGYFSPYNNPRLDDGLEGEYLTDRLTDEAIKLLENNGDPPFFLYLPYYSVHTPIQAPDEDVLYFKEKAKRLGLDKINPYYREKIDFYTENHQNEYINRRIIQSDPTYAGMIKRLDENVGRIIDTVKRLGKEKDTIIIFYSDNGGLSDSDHPPTSNKPLRYGKSYVYEGGIREPLIIKWPNKIKANVETDIPITTPDIYPTILECCGIPLRPKQHIDGQSFYPILERLENLENLQDRGPIYWHYPHYNGNGARPASVIIDGGWKLIEWLEDGHLALFNLKADVSEETNLINQKGDVAAKLLKQLNKWRNEVKAKIPKPNPNYHLCFALDRLRLKGKLNINSDNTINVKAQLSRENPILYDIPIEEILEDFFEKTILLKINNRIRTGHLEVDENPLCINFYDTHKETKSRLADLLGSLKKQNVQIKGWSNFREQYLDKKNVLPQVEIMKYEGRE
ncbi:MAG: sulfatase-like hydrolase/transferase [Candidatus Lokiarchaeota archaeon]|nr:sulfatase-like hydrolase/transferase [Candidatus Lokiarchaeota archaeon]